jgi:hypothetical protein
MANHGREAGDPKTKKPMTTSACAIDGNWNPAVDFCSKGVGVEGEGKIVDLRFHTCTAKDRVERFIAITLNVNVAYKVAVDKYGADLPLDKKDFATSDRVYTTDALVPLIGVPADLQSNPKSALHPASAGNFEVWAGAETDARKLEIGDELHFLTDKDSFLIKKYFHTKMGSFEGLEGGQVMSEMSQLASGQKLGKMEQEDMEGVDSDEWGDDDDEDD